MDIFIVIPCLNEERHLATTCKSLGFGCGESSPVRLVLVDNGSTDQTGEVINEIQRASRSGQVLSVYEPIRGYVPARRAGMAEVIALVKREALDADNVLVLQADADTIYLPGYVDAMRSACTNQRNVLFEGQAVTGREFSKEFQEFDGLCRAVDCAMEPLLAADEFQVVVDDKVCGFFLADYLMWGGHEQDADHMGRPIHAETTRLHIRALLTAGARRITVEGALAVASRRKLWTQAPAYFASSGFPRDQEWINTWTPGSLLATDFLKAPLSWADVGRAKRSRQRHQLALFGVLPALLQDDQNRLKLHTELLPAVALPSTYRPGELLGYVLALADEEVGLLSAFLQKHEM